ncbi:hypothetical protein MCOR29_010061 [Pyricularia oryzae]|nr:hypothetical protein MCOR26_010143 [Pyricularia oryzae]KAI6306568.1 hypothetical protein MCOR29_010061 [Pyricularia oryzae]KAI6356864.1 hypothetical protein MCOR31_010510 [Pyricularia oryzae]KAI6443769.1 hypothetical protein MCOR15_011146 [Pyricularia oryzae]KAI6462791.1 hypothetical protein MCOR18_010867 [Pyricularia oryzae]
MSITLNAQDFTGVAYAEQEEVYFNDGREKELLDYVLNHPSVSEIRGHPQRVLDVIDEFGRNQKYLMNIGEYKGRTVREIIYKHKPATMVELGGYVGYSAVAFAAAAREAGGERYISIEHNPYFAHVIEKMVELAGLKEFVTVVVGDSTEALKGLHNNGTLKHIDLLFLDHLKPLYTQDLQLCEELELVGPGTVLAADNGKLPHSLPPPKVVSLTLSMIVVKPGNPPYLRYVRSTVAEKRDAKAKAMHMDATGNPNLIYESQFVEGWEPSGVPDALEITHCVGIESY